ncbi:MAG: acyl-CoA dehydrogenase family protein [Bacteroidales bacterium]|nr:MAG: acyl-CoA dehydrogenase family protein [Bacteroidales bacterium]
MENSKAVKGGEFMVKETEAGDVFIPEEFDEEQKMIAQTCQDFLDTEVMPILDRIDNQEEGLMQQLLHKSGELGLLGISLPEEYNGFGQSFVTSMLTSEILGAGYSYAVAYSCHTGIGSLPILYYGNEEQKQKYLPRLATGELLGAYCLTEPGAGSDANSGKTKAVLSDDGKHYILNGQKMWITNAGFADLFTVFAKIDNDRVLSAFIVERDFPGISFNPEEKKMGIKGSSTRQIFFNDCSVPVENLLGERGEGFRIALNILHMGRIKLGGNVLGAAKCTINQSVGYANERKQFGTLIANFGAIKYKLAEQVIKIFVTESAVYRASRNIDEAVERNLEECTKEKAMIDAFGQLAIEAAILKVFGSEMLDYIVDEAVQIHGGMGYSAEMQVDRGYRDSRINRIFEGTNEINRLLVVDTLLKRGMKREYDLFGEAKNVAENLSSLSSPEPPHPQDYYGKKRTTIKNFKNIALMIIHYASEKFQRKLLFEQEILNNISDIIMNLYIAESTALRVQKLENVKGEEAIKIYRDILDVFVYDAAGIIRKAGMDAVNSFAGEEEKDLMLNGINVYSTVEGLNIKEARRRIADKLIEDNTYTF